MTCYIGQMSGSRYVVNGLHVFCIVLKLCLPVCIAMHPHIHVCVLGEAFHVWCIVPLGALHLSQC